MTNDSHDERKHFPTARYITLAVWRTNVPISNHFVHFSANLHIIACAIVIRGNILANMVVSTLQIITRSLCTPQASSIRLCHLFLKFTPNNAPDLTH